MTLPIDLRVFIASDGMVELGEGKLFHCLSGIRGNCHVSIGDAVEWYCETDGDSKWDIVIIDCGCFISALRVVFAIQNFDPEQQVIVMHPALKQVAEFARGLYVPRNGQMLAKAFERLGIGGET